MTRAKKSLCFRARCIAAATAKTGCALRCPRASSPRFPRDLIEAAARIAIRARRDAALRDPIRNFRRSTVTERAGLPAGVLRRDARVVFDLRQRPDRLAGALVERSADRDARAPFEIRRRHDHRSRRRRRGPQTDRQLPGLRAEETDRAVREFADRLVDVCQCGHGR